MDYSPLDRLGRLAAMAVILMGLLVMLAPIVMTAMLSFSERFAFPPTGITIRWYANFVSRPELTAGLGVSLLLGLSVMIVSLTVGTGVALSLTRNVFRRQGALQSFFLSPIVLPRVAIGVALFLFFVTARVPGTLLRLFVLHLVITCPYVIAAVTASLQGINPNLEEAAMNLGAPPLETFLKVTLPLIRPGIVAGAIFAFVVSFDEVTASIFLTDARTTTFPVALFSYLARGALDPTVAAASSFMLVCVALVGAVLAKSVGLARALGVSK